jgi:DNA-directed RNA polymerase specialized sigma subunit
MSPRIRLSVDRLGKRASERDRQIVSQAWKAEQVAKKINSFTGLPEDELRDAALEYIVKIYDTWDGSKGANFSTWVNRCLQFHMMNYLRDNSRLIKIPRSYSDLYLKIRKFIIKNPDVTDEEIAGSLGVALKKVRAVRQAFAMSFSQINEYSSVIESDIESTISLEDFMSNYKTLLFRVSELDEKDETFLTDFLIKKRSVSTITRKNPHLKNMEDIKAYSEKLIEGILCEETNSQ